MSRIPAAAAAALPLLLGLTAACSSPGSASGAPPRHDGVNKVLAEVRGIT